MTRSNWLVILLILVVGVCSFLLRGCVGSEAKKELAKCDGESLETFRQLVNGRLTEDGKDINFLLRENEARKKEFAGLSKEFKGYRETTDGLLYLEVEGGGKKPLKELLKELRERSKTTKASPGDTLAMGGGEARRRNDVPPPPPEDDAPKPQPSSRFRLHSGSFPQGCVIIQDPTCEQGHQWYRWMRDAQGWTLCVFFRNPKCCCKHEQHGIWYPAQLHDGYILLHDGRRVSALQFPVP